MKKIILGVCLFSFNLTLQAQNNGTSYQETGRNLMRYGKFDSAIMAFDKALETKPNDVDLLKDKAYASYLNRDFATSISIGEELVKRPDADPQSFQILGLCYKAIASYKEGDKMYKAAIQKFPKSGVLYSEYGDLLQSDNNREAAIKIWQKGIEEDPGQSGNYYYAAKYYAQNNNLIWSLLYGEIFINLESLSQRTTEIKKLMLEDYKKLFSSPYLLNDLAKNKNPFVKAVAISFNQYNGSRNKQLNTETLTDIRKQFVENWFRNQAEKIPYALFERQQSLIKKNLFTAYNQWIFGPVSDDADYKRWVNENGDAMEQYLHFQRYETFKIPNGQPAP